MIKTASLAGVGLPIVLLSLAPAVASAQEKFPSKPIEMIIPVAPGGGVDTSHRLIAELAEPLLGTKIVVINKPGSSGALGTSAIIQARPDGYTIGGIWNAPLTMTPHILSVPYGPNDYIAVSQTTSAPTIVCAKKAFPASNGKELIELFRQNPRKYTYGNDGIGNVVQLAVERILIKFDAKARGVPFNGAAETLKAFLGDHIDLYAGSIAPMQPYLKDGSAKCLIVTSVEKNDAAPEATSLSELGIPDEATSNWRGIIAPKHVPADRVTILEKAFRAAAQSDRFRAVIAARGEEARSASSAEMQQQLDAEYRAMGTIINAIGLAKK